MDSDKEKQQPPRLQPTESVSEGQQHMDKPFTVWTAMGLGHSITNTAITITVGLSSGVAFGGPPLFFYGFILMAMVAFCVAISLGELASAMPHTGGQYFWVATLAPPRARRFLSYVTGIVAWAGAVCTGASVCLAIPIMLFNMVVLQNPNFVYKPWMGFVGFQITNLLAFSFNLFERVLPWVSKTILGYTIATLIVVFVGVLAASDKKQTAENFFVQIYNISGWPNGVAFLIGLNAANWAFSCLDAVVHLADEIPQPRRNIPRALLITVCLGSFTGLLLIFALFFAAPDLDLIAGAATPSLQLFYAAFGNNKAAALGLQALVGISASGSIIGIHTWQCRMAWAFSRDKGFPFHRYLSQIAPEPFSTPIWAHVWSCTWMALLGCLYLGSSLAFNSLVAAGILLQYLTYSVSIGCLLWYGRSRLQHGPFWFPKLGYVANLVTIGWTLVALVMYSFPYYLPVEADQMNYVSCVLVGVFLYAASYWFIYGRKEFQLPQPQSNA